MRTRDVQIHRLACIVGCVATLLWNASSIALAEVGASTAEQPPQNAPHAEAIADPGLPAQDLFASATVQAAAREKQIKQCEAKLAQSPAESKLRRRLGILYSQAPEGAEKAKRIFEQLLKEHENSDSLMDYASCFYRTSDDETYRLCSKAEKTYNGHDYTRAMIKLVLAGTRYRKNESQAAERLYKECLAALVPGEPAFTARLALAGLAGVYWQEGRFEESAKSYEELYKLNRDAFGVDDVECGWSLLQESYAIAKTHKDDRDKPLYTRAIWVFRKCNFDHILSEYEAKHQQRASPETLASINKAIFGVSGSDAPADPIPAAASSYASIVNTRAREFVSPWKKNFKQTEAPGWVWFDPDTPVKYVLLCIHGLGLHHRSFESFARRVAPEGVLTVAMDVRGFGTYVDANGLEKLSMNDCVRDLKGLVKLLRRDYPDLPLFVLGESMGGALSLRVVAESEDSVDGLICSVPSGSRHKGFSTALEVGANYIVNKRKPIAVGKKVVQQATAKSDLQSAWINDPSSRLSLSPAELLDFQQFMDENVDVARKLRSTPVILFQGHDDKLVKEKGTLDLFDALSTPQKSMVILGSTEHLIFEEGQFKDDLTLGVIGWMSAHGKKVTSKESQAPGQPGCAIPNNL
jgi:alpha-beta hydrolase superfamily lysophospholipase/tetratricopeptide (TPR) repeat protein